LTLKTKNEDAEIISEMNDEPVIDNTAEVESEEPNTTNTITTDIVKASHEAGVYAKDYDISTMSNEQLDSVFTAKVEAFASTAWESMINMQSAKKKARQLLIEIREISDKLEIPHDKVRNIVKNTLMEKGVSESWIRKILPHELKLTNRTNKRYLDKTTGSLKSSVSSEEDDEDDETETGQTIDITPDQKNIKDRIIADQKSEILKLLAKLDEYKQKEKQASKEGNDIITDTFIMKLRGHDIPVQFTFDIKNRKMLDMQVNDEKIKKKHSETSAKASASASA